MKKVALFPLSSGFALFLIFLLVLNTLNTQGQKQELNLKVSPLVDQKIISSNSRNTFVFRIMTTRVVSKKFLKFTISKIGDYDSISFYNIRATPKELADSVLPLKEVLFVEDGTRLPKEELLLKNLDLTTNKINVVHRKFPHYNGQGLTVSIKENSPDTTDIDFIGRYVSTTLSSSIINSHASVMATIIAGGGNSWQLGKGTAWGSRISSSNFENLLPDPPSEYQQHNIMVQNHSYGVGIENFYGGEAAAYDASAISSPSLLHVFSSGNAGTSASSIGTYTGINGFANLTGNFKMAKNILTVGGTDLFENVTGLSSKGPAFDGRVKPELVASGIEGSSGAAALVSGVSLMLQQQYRKLNGVLPPNALIKSVLLNSADDKGNKQVDYSNGYGSLNALNAIKTIEGGHYMSGSVKNGGKQNFLLSIPPKIKTVKITLVWNDPPARPNSAKALVNDLDLEILNTTTNETWKPWVLNVYPNADSLNKVATRKRDSLNNIEQVTIDSPTAGVYQVNISGYSISSGLQNYYIAYQFDSLDIFEWNFPTEIDPVYSSSVNTVGWNSTFSGKTGKLDYSIDNGATWEMIDSAVDLSTRYYKWNTPSVVSSAILKMKIGQNEITSDTFVIGSLLSLRVGFNCSDSVLFYWDKLPSTNTYSLYTMGNHYMEPMLSTTDSFVVLGKNVLSSKNYAVAPIIAGIEAIRSYTTDYTTQGVNCYINSLFVSLINKTAQIRFGLGSLYNIKKIVLEKREGSAFKALQQQSNFNSTLLNFIDSTLVKGLNFYRIKLEMTGGGVVYSSEKSIFYFNQENYVLYPNPVAQNQDINIAQQNVGDAFLEVFNTLGIKIFEQNIQGRIAKIPVGTLSKGLYFLRITKNGKGEATMTLVVD